MREEFDPDSWSTPPAAIDRALALLNDSITTLSLKNRSLDLDAYGAIVQRTLQDRYLRVSLNEKDHSTLLPPLLR